MTGHIRDSPVGPQLNGAKEISFGLGDDLRRGALIADARQRQWFRAPFLSTSSRTPSLSFPRGVPPFCQEASRCFHARDSGESNSRSCARTPGRQHQTCTTGVRKSLKGLVPMLVVYVASRGTMPCTCWSSRRTGAAEISEILSSRHVPVDQTYSMSRNVEKISDRML